MNNLNTSMLTILIVGIVLVTVGGFLLAKKNSRSYRVLDTKGKERLFPELVKKLKEEDAEYHMYTNMTESLYRGAALVMIRDFYSGGDLFREYIPHVSHGGEKRDTQFFEVYERLWEEQLKGIIPFAKSKEFIDEAHQILKWMDTPLSDGSRRFVVDGKDLFPKERLIRMAQGVEGTFYKDFAVFQRAMEAYNLFTFEGYGGHISLGRVSIPSKFYSKESWEKIRTFVDKAFVDVFVTKRIACTHSTIINYINLRLPKEEVVPKWYEWLKVNGSDYGKNDKDHSK